MKFDISRQSLFPATLILLALAVVMIWFGPTGTTELTKPAVSTRLTERPTGSGRSAGPSESAGLSDPTIQTGQTGQAGQIEQVGQTGRTEQAELTGQAGQTEQTGRIEPTRQTEQAVQAGRPETAGSVPEAFLGRLLGEFLVRHPFLGRLLLLALTLATGLTIGRTGIRYALYPAKTCIGISLFGFLGCGVTGGGDLPMAIVAAYCWARALSHYVAALRNGYSFDRLFRGSMFLGLVPLVQPALTPLVLVLPLVLLQFKRTTREGIVALAGLLLMPLLSGYLCWAWGLSFWTPVQPVVQAMRLDGVMPWTQLPLYLYPVLGLTLLLVIYTLGCFVGDRHSAGNRRLVLYPLLFYAFVLCAALLAVPVAGGNVATVTLVTAVVTALLLPYLFIRLQRNIALASYAGVAVLSLLRIGFGLFL